MLTTTLVLRRLRWADEQYNLLTAELAESRLTHEQVVDAAARATLAAAEQCHFGRYLTHLHDLDPLDAQFARLAPGYPARKEVAA